MNYNFLYKAQRGIMGQVLIDFLVKMTPQE